MKTELELQTIIETLKREIALSLPPTTKSRLVHLTDVERASKRLELAKAKNELSILRKPSNHFMATADPKIISIRDLLRRPEKWVENYCKINHVDINMWGMSMDGESDSVKHQTFLNKCKLKYMDDVHAYNDSAVGPHIELCRTDMFMAGVQLNYIRMRKEHLASVISKIKFDHRVGDSELRKWHAQTTANADEASLAVVKHAMQNVKRKMLGLRVDFHIFPIWVGPGGDGKTKAVEQLMKAIEEFCLQFTVDQVSDPTIIGGFEDNFAIICDEMAHASKVDIGILKRAITAPAMDGRPPYAARLEKVRQNCGFFGTSNEPVKSIIRDKDMRRFFEIRSRTRSVEDYAKMDAMDSVKMWQCIDENDMNCYYNSSKSAIKIAQRELCSPDFLVLWAEDNNVIPQGDEPVKWKSVSELHYSFKSFMENSNVEYGGSVQSLGDKLHNVLNLKKKQVTSRDGKKYVVYAISERSPVTGFTDVATEIEIVEQTSNIKI